MIRCLTHSLSHRVSYLMMFLLCMLVLQRDHVMYGAPKVTTCESSSNDEHDDHINRSKRFHHSSFFGGKAVAAAGIFITNDKGIITHLFPHSGHYRPGEAHIQRVLFYLYEKGIDLCTLTMDTQQIFHVARDQHPSPQHHQPTLANHHNNTEHTISGENNVVSPANDCNKKKKKIESLYLMPAIHVACYLAHKARCIELGILHTIHNIYRKTKKESDILTSINTATE